MSANIPHKDYRFLLPMLEHGVSPVLAGMRYALTALSELYVLLFFQHHVRGTFKRWHMVILVLFLALLAVGPAAAAISEFGPLEAQKMRYPAFVQWRLVSIGHYVEHVDFFAVFQWLSGAMIRLSLAIHLLSEFVPVKRWKQSWLLTAGIGLILVVASYFGINQMLHYQKALKWSYSYLGLIIMALVSILWLAAILRSKRRKVRKEEE